MIVIVTYLDPLGKVYCSSPKCLKAQKPKKIGPFKPQAEASMGCSMVRRPKVGSRAEDPRLHADLEEFTRVHKV